MSHPPCGPGNCPIGRRVWDLLLEGPSESMQPTPCLRAEEPPWSWQAVGLVRHPQTEGPASGTDPSGVGPGPERQGRGVRALGVKGQGLTGHLGKAAELIMGGCLA